MLAMVAASGARILSAVDFKGNKFNLFIVPGFDVWMPHVIALLIASDILLAAFSAVLLNLLFNGSKGGSEDEMKHAALATKVTIKACA